MFATVPRFDSHPQRAIAEISCSLMPRLLDAESQGGTRMTLERNSAVESDAAVGAQSAPTVFSRAHDLDDRATPNQGRQHPNLTIKSS